MTITQPTWDAIQLLITAIISLALPYLAVRIKRRQVAPVIPIPIGPNECDRVLREYADLERMLSTVLLGSKIGHDDLALLCYDVLGISLDSMGGDGHTEQVIALLIKARQTNKLLLVWTRLIRARPDLAERLA